MSKLQMDFDFSNFLSQKYIFKMCFIVYHQKDILFELLYTIKLFIFEYNLLRV